MVEVVRRFAVRVARSAMIERASASAKLCATKLYCPRLVAIKLVDEGDRAHAKLGELAFRHLPQRAVEAARTQEEGRVQQRAVDLALEHAGTHEVEKALDEHLAHAVEAEREGRAFAQTRRRAVVRIEANHEFTKRRVLPVP